MEADKENIEKPKTFTRIPVPIGPLPPIPQHLIETKKLKNNILNERHPLRTLNAQHLALPGPSKNLAKANQKKVKRRIDARHITLRPKAGSSDWHYRVYKDDEKSVKEDPVIIISDDESITDVQKLEQKKTEGCFVEVRPFTPASSSTLEPSRVKNIKRSLKRPHSRELQGLSPVRNAKKDEEKARRKLCFGEPLHDRLRSPDYWKKTYMKCLGRDYVSDIFSHLLNAEQKPAAIPMVPSTIRACVINWLMKVNGADENPAVIQTACWYLDSVFGTGQVQIDKLQLVAAACYWIAQKLHSPGLPATRLVRCANNAFTVQNLLNAEKLILRRLNFPRQPVIPQEFINYMSWWCDNDHPGEIEVGATFLCMCGLMVDRSLCNEQSSVIAAAAVRSSLMLLKKGDLLSTLQTCPVFKAVEKNTSRISHVASLLRRAVRAVSSPLYEYKTPFEQYGVPPHYIAQKIQRVAGELYNPDSNMFGIEI